MYFTIDYSQCKSYGNYLVQLNDNSKGIFGGFNGYVITNNKKSGIQMLRDEFGLKGKHIEIKDKTV